LGDRLNLNFKKGSLFFVFKSAMINNQFFKGFKRIL
jgi:hypothetical protein